MTVHHLQIKKKIIEIRYHTKNVLQGWDPRGLLFQRVPPLDFFPYSFNIFISPFITHLLIQALFLSLHPCRFESRCRKPWFFFSSVVKFIAMIILHFHLYLSHFFLSLSFFSLSFFFVSFFLSSSLRFSLSLFLLLRLPFKKRRSLFLITIQICTTASENCNNKASQFEKLLNATKTWNIIVAVIQSNNPTHGKQMI